MDGRFVVVGLTIVLPAVLMAMTVVWYSTNPISMLVLFSVMLLGALYLLSYADTYTSNPS